MCKRKRWNVWRRQINQQLDEDVFTRCDKRNAGGDGRNELARTVRMYSYKHGDVVEGEFMAGRRNLQRSTCRRGGTCAGRRLSWSDGKRQMVEVETRGSDGCEGVNYEVDRKDYRIK